MPPSCAADFTQQLGHSIKDRGGAPALRAFVAFACELCLAPLHPTEWDEVVLESFCLIDLLFCLATNLQFYCLLVMVLSPTTQCSVFLYNILCSCLFCYVLSVMFSVLSGSVSVSFLFYYEGLCLM